MPDKRVSCIITPEQHAAFKKACVDLGVTMDQWLKDAVLDAIQRAERQKGAGER